jgi:hypothetical protein
VTCQTFKRALLLLLCCCPTLSGEPPSSALRFKGNDPVAEGTGLALWSTETHITDNGGTDLITVFADGYMSQNLTSFRQGGDYAIMAL